MREPVFLTQLHKQRFQELLSEDNTYLGDVERIALFYIVAGNGDLYGKRSFIYDSKEHSIKRNCLRDETVDFSSGMKSLIRLGFNLYNDYTDDYISPVRLFYNLDQRNGRLALNAIDIRFISE